MAANYLHGVETTEVDDGAVSIRLIKTAIIGLVGTAPVFEVDADYRTTNEPILILSDTAAAKYFGTARDGYTIPQALDAIFDQQTNGAGAGAVIVVNVFDPEGGERVIDVPAAEWTFAADGAINLGREDISGVMVKNTALTHTYVSGVDYEVENATGVVTRLDEGAIPALATVSVSYAYTNSHTSDWPEGAAMFDDDGALLCGKPGVSNVAVKSADGATTYVLGVDYTVEPIEGVITRLSTGGIAAGATVKLSFSYADPSKVLPSEIIGWTNTAGQRLGMQAWKDCRSKFGYVPKLLIAPGYSPLTAVRAELDVLAESLRAICFADAPVGTTFQQALEGRGSSGSINFNTSSARTVLCYPHCTVYDTASDTTVLQPYSPRLAGAQAARDQDEGYWWSPSNRELQGISGMEILLTAGVNDPNSEVNCLNEVGITTIFNAYGTGFRTWGNRSAAWPTVTNPKNFINIRRVADVIAESIEYSMLQFIDRPINNAFIDAVTESVNSFLRTLVARGAVLDGRCWYDKGKNEATQLAAGHIVFCYDFMPPPPAERITFESRVNINYLSALNASANTVAAATT
ncbi:hypothetical protein JCM15519_04370 [Fundidesulfovibrio butyratiphilus]